MTTQQISLKSSKTLGPRTLLLCGVALLGQTIGVEAQAAKQARSLLMARSSNASKAIHPGHVSNFGGSDHRKNTKFLSSALEVASQSQQGVTTHNRIDGSVVRVQTNEDRSCCLVHQFGPHVTFIKKHTPNKDGVAKFTRLMLGNDRTLEYTEAVGESLEDATQVKTYEQNGTTEGYRSSQAAIDNAKPLHDGGIEFRFRRSGKNGKSSEAASYRVNLKDGHTVGLEHLDKLLANQVDQTLQDLTTTRKAAWNTQAELDRFMKDLDRDPTEEMKDYAQTVAAYMKGK